MYIFNSKHLKVFPTPRSKTSKSPQAMVVETLLGTAFGFALGFGLALGPCAGLEGVDAEAGRSSSPSFMGLASVISDMKIWYSYFENIVSQYSMTLYENDIISIQYTSVLWVHCDPSNLTSNKCQSFLHMKVAVLEDSMTKTEKGEGIGRKMQQKLSISLQYSFRWTKPGTRAWYDPFKGHLGLDALALSEDSGCIISPDRLSLPMRLARSSDSVCRVFSPAWRTHPNLKKSLGQFSLSGENML